MTNPSNSMNQAQPAGWFSDPSGGPGARWWDGQRWTQHVSTPAPQMYSPRTRPRQVDPATPLYTPYIWFIVLHPVVWVLLATFWNANRYRFFSFVSSPTNPFAQLAGEMFSLIETSFIVLLYVLCVLFAFLDRRVLLQRGFDRPFHWAWTFLGAAVYVVGRSLVVRNRSSGGLLPMGVFIGIIVVLGSVAIVAVVAFVFALTETFG